MAYFICIAAGFADFSPSTQDYHACATLKDLRATVAAYARMFDSTCEDVAPYRYRFRAFKGMGDNWTQRIRIARDTDYVLDIIGMTEADYLRESDGD